MSFLWNSVKYKGLRNQGATCYLNSVLQVLFMTEDFREAVERDPESEEIDPQLKSLFDKLKNQTTDTTDITKKLEIKRVYEQQDAAEYFEKILNLTSHKASQIFHGELTHSTLCSGCDTHTDTDGKFWHLPLTLVDSCGEYSVVNGIEKYFKALTFSGENQMYCEQCDDKRDAISRCVMRHHPEVLTLLLKRFELDYCSMTYFKINCSVCIPHTLQIPENQTYELYAVVEHFGDLESGHYTACIKSQEEDRWFHFDDSWVKELNVQPFQSQNFERSDSAYLLFYRKKSVPPPETQRPENIREEFAPGGCSPSTSDVDQREDAVMVNGGEETEEKAEPGINMKVVDIDRVSVCSEEEVKLPEPHCQDLEIRDYFMQGNHEENDERNDSHLQIQDREKEEVKTPDEEEAEEKDHVSGERPRVESERQNVKIMRQGCAQEVCVNALIENEGNAMEGKRKRDRRGWDQGDEGKDEVGKSMRVDPDRRQEGGGDTESYREVKQEAEKMVRGEEVKSGPDEEESRSRKLLTKLDLDGKIQDKGAQNVPKAYQGRNSRYESREQHRVEKEHKSHQVTDERSSDDNGQERAHPVHVFVSAAETQRRRHSERAQDRGRSSHSRGALVRSRSLPERQKEVRKSEKQAEPDEGTEEEKQHLKESGVRKEEEEKKPEVEEMTLETPTSRKRQRESSTALSELFRCFTIHSKTKRVKITPETESETLEQAAVLTNERKAKKRSKEKKKRVKTLSYFSCSRNKQTSESESD